MIFGVILGGTQMANYVIATTKSWNISNAEQIKNQFSQHKFFLVTEKERLTLSWLNAINPDFIFFPHWSWIIPSQIYDAYPCVVFHMTDLPYGRGGSPLQNLIVRGVYQTKISAIKVEKGLDTGDIYLKEPVDISYGNADQILSRISEIIFTKMIPQLLRHEIVPHPQIGEVVTFKRRTPEESEMPENLSIRQRYDFIRMLDGEGYPNAFIRIHGKKIFLTNASIHNGKLIAKATWEE